MKYYLLLTLVIFTIFFGYSQTDENRKNFRCIFNHQENIIDITYRMYPLDTGGARKNMIQYFRSKYPNTKSFDTTNYYKLTENDYKCIFNDSINLLIHIRTVFEFENDSTQFSMDTFNLKLDFSKDSIDIILNLKP